MKNENYYKELASERYAFIEMLKTAITNIYDDAGDNDDELAKHFFKEKGGDLKKIMEERSAITERLDKLFDDINAYSRKMYNDGATDTRKWDEVANFITELKEDE